MFRKFAEGLVYGSGFAIAVLVVAFIGAPILISKFSLSGAIAIPAYTSSTRELIQEDSFHDLPIEEQIKRASVIVLARYEPASDGKMKAVVKEFLKKDPGTIFHYDLGDEYAPSSYFPKEGTRYGDGIVIFFAGSPAMMRVSMTYSGDRIHSLGDMPMELLRNKCSDENA